MSDTQETMTTEAAAPEATLEKPKRGRPRKKAEEAPAPAPASAAEGAEAPAAPAKKTTRRRAAAKPADEAAAPAATEAPTAEEAPKPRRTRARKTPEPAAEEGTGAATHAASTTSETSEEAPKPRRARARQEAGHIRALDRARTGADADCAHLALRQSFDFFMQMHGVLKQCVRLPQADRALGYGQQAAAVAPFARACVIDRSRGAVIGRVDPQKALRHRSRPFPASRARPHPERR